LGTVNVFGCTSFLVWSGVPRRKDAVEMGMKLRNLKMAFAAVAGIVVLAGATYPVQGAAGPGNGVTHLRVTSQVILPGVTRLGINLGGQNYYDSGQIMKNPQSWIRGDELPQYSALPVRWTGPVHRCRSRVRVAGRLLGWGQL
jgi:hypothetical protein